MKLKDIAIYVKDRVEIEKLSLHNYISTENMLPEKGGVQTASSLPSISMTSGFRKDDILTSNIRPYFKKIWIANKEGGCSNDVLVLRAKNNCHPKFLYYVLSENRFFDYSTASAKGTKMPRGDKSAIMEYKVPDYCVPEQIQIADILSSLDDKIAFNKRINDNLEKSMSTLFDFYFGLDNSESNKYKGAFLTDIATFINGLAMQKFRPKEDEKGIPVLKIKELGQKSCDSSSDICSPSIKSDYIVNDGDVIFSWSGTLLVDIWSGGKCGLNQHLFKVTSSNYPLWFAYLWTRMHLNNFIRISKDKAVTMGHIKRVDLERAEISIPTDDTMQKLDKIFTPIFDSCVTIRVENRKLSQIRDSLLPKLMSGELKTDDLHR